MFIDEIYDMFKIRRQGMFIKKIKKMLEDLLEVTQSEDFKKSVKLKEKAKQMIDDTEGLAETARTMLKSELEQTERLLKTLDVLKDKIYER